MSITGNEDIILSSELWKKLFILGASRENLSDVDCFHVEDLQNVDEAWRKVLVEEEYHATSWSNSYLTAAVTASIGMSNQRATAS